MNTPIEFETQKLLLRQWRAADRQPFAWGIGIRGSPRKPPEGLCALASRCWSCLKL
jgi:hypothetical protein